jgi:hypothetical protein
MTSPVDGFTLGNVRPSAAAPHSPPMSRRFGPPARNGMAGGAVVDVMAATLPPLVSERSLSYGWPPRPPAGARHRVSTAVVLDVPAA